MKTSIASLPVGGEDLFNPGSVLSNRGVFRKFDVRTLLQYGTSLGLNP